jgi:drug/metabolite transporter (DMT)-like permease
MHERALAIATFTAICIIWGTTFLAIRVAIETMPTLYLTGLRFTIVGVILLVIALLRCRPLPQRASQWGHEALTGILLVPLANSSVVWAEHYISSGLACGVRQHARTPAPVGLAVPVPGNVRDSPFVQPIEKVGGQWQKIPRQR